MYVHIVGLHQVEGNSEMLVTEFECWIHLCDVDDYNQYKELFFHISLVTKKSKSVTNISSLSPTHFSPISISKKDIELEIAAFKNIAIRYYWLFFLQLNNHLVDLLISMNATVRLYIDKYCIYPYDFIRFY